MQTLLILHGAIGASEQFIPLADKLRADNIVLTLDFSGHGGMAYTEEPFSIKLFAEDVLSLLDDEGIGKVSIFGYSMGGYVAMYLAKHHPERVHKIVTLATKFRWDEETAAKEIKMLNADKIAEKLPAFAETLAKRHALNDWKEVLRKTSDMLIAMGKSNPLSLADYEDIAHECMILIGDRDKMITLDETINVYKALPNARMGMLPDTHHPIEQVNEAYLLYFIRQFIR